MPSNAEKAFELFQAAIGQEEGIGEWFEVTQDRIDGFADVTEDHQFIHVDHEYPDGDVRRCIRDYYLNVSPWPVAPLLAGSAASR